MQDCIEWAGGRTSLGYGLTREGRKPVYAHRAAYEEAHGPIPPGHVIHHLCCNRACVNVGHMELLLRDEHMGGRGHGKLLRKHIPGIRELLRQGWLQKDIAAAYGVSQQAVSKIGARKRWAAA